MPLTLYRYIAWEVTKVLLLTTAILVVVISMAVSIKPLSEGLLDAKTTIRFLIYTMPTVIGIALPFAGAFASTVVFLRMASDNEVSACSATGISYASILAPVAVIGVVCTVLLFVSSNVIVPQFMRRAAQTLEADVLSLIVAQVRQDRTVRLDDWVLRADGAVAGDAADTPMPSPELEPIKQAKLTNLAVGEMDDDGVFRTEVTADVGTVLLIRDQATRRTYAYLRVSSGQQFDAEAKEMYRTWNEDNQEKVFGPFRIPDRTRDQIKFRSWAELRQLEEQPEREQRVGQAVRELEARLAEVHARQAFVEAAADDEPLSLDGPLANDGERVWVMAPVARETADGIELEGTRDRPIVVMAGYAGTNRASRYEAPRGTVSFDAIEGGKVIEVRITLRSTAPRRAEVRLYAVDHTADLPLPVWQPWGETLDPTTKATAELDPASMTIPFVGETGRDMGVEELVAMSMQPAFTRDAAVQKARGWLRATLIRLAKNLRAQTHLRAATAVSCMLLIVLGAVLSIQMRGAQPLFVYLWTFLLAVTAIIIVHTGENFTTSGTDTSVAPGLAMIWSGNLILAVVIGAVYCRLARN